jgi:predicted NACHT family NTPase
VGLFGAGRVWLLLDGVDEMPVAAGSPLGEMGRQVRLGGLLEQARLVLTCRLNLWDGDRHALDSLARFAFTSVSILTVLPFEPSLIVLLVPDESFPVMRNSS